MFLDEMMAFNAGNRVGSLILKDVRSIVEKLFLQRITPQVYV